MLNDRQDPCPDGARIAAERARNGGRVHHLEPVPGELPELTGLELDAPADFVAKRLADSLFRDPIAGRENHAVRERNERDPSPSRTGDERPAAEPGERELACDIFEGGAQPP